MALQQPPAFRLKFKPIGVHERGTPWLLPQGYRLATLEEIGGNKDIFRKLRWLGEGREMHLLDNLPSLYLENLVAVKKKEWDVGFKKWRNCSAFYSSHGNSLRKQLYDGITLHTEEEICCAWTRACIYEDVELLYWLWQNYMNPFDPDFFNLNIAPDVRISLRKTVERLGNRESGSELQMENAREEVGMVLESAKGEGTSDWGVAKVELFIQVYGQAFVETAAAITFTNVESVPIFTKLLSLSLHQLEDQIPNIKPRFSEVLIEAVERGYSELVDNMMVKFKDDIAHITTADCVRALRAGVHRGCIELVGSLLDLLQSRNGVELPVEVDDKGMTLFHYALFHEGVFRRLQEIYGGLADNVITRQDKFGRNFLHWAAKGACDSQVVYDIIEEFISSADRLILCHQRDDRGRTPFHIAASKGHSGMIEKLLSWIPEGGRTKYIQETDSTGRTALLMAANEGHEDSIKMLLRKGSKPAEERDGKKRTALHHAALVEDPKLALATCKALVENTEDPEKSLVLWASATGIGTADEMKDVDSDVKNYIRRKKKEHRGNLLRAAAVTDNAEMAWELLNRGAEIADHFHRQWRGRLNSRDESAVRTVISHMHRMKEQEPDQPIMEDQPSMEDNLGRRFLAEGVAALFLNRFIGSPITIGISGEWGMGKSSLMIQIEKTLLITAAQLTFPNLLPQEEFDGAQKIPLSTSGEKIYQQIKSGVHNLLDLSKHNVRAQKMSLGTRNRKIYQQIKNRVCSKDEHIQNTSQNPLVAMLTKYQSQYHVVYKALACMANNQMEEEEEGQEQERALRGVPRILTIRYNAWHYRDRHEAWAGLGVAITKEIENAMTRAQWMSTCWRYTWAKHRLSIWIQIFLPCLLSISLAGWVAWIVWMLLKQAKFEGLKYGSIPFTVIAIAWVVLKSVISVVQPVSTQMLGYITKPDHARHLGYQEDVIADINFLKKELGEKPHWFFSFILGVWCWNWFGLCADVIENTRIPKFTSASGDQIRIVTFVDDLDRCEEEVILQVLSAINLVLAECKINVILGTDKKMIARAIKRKFEDINDEDIAEKFICKVIQIPLSLPDPTGEETKNFLKTHLGCKIPAKYMKKENALRSPDSIILSGEPARQEEGTSTRQEAETISTGQEENVDTCCHNTVLNIDCIELEQGCKGFIRKVVEGLDCLLEFARIKVREPVEEGSFLLESAEGVRLIRELLIPNYTEEEANIFYELSEFASGNQKLPREWKRLLHYHKFAWYVLFRIGDLHNLPTWKEELIGWIFVCWQWKHEINHLIKNWHKYTINRNIDGRQRYYRGPPLSQIVAKIVAEQMDQSKISQKGEIVAEPLNKFKISQSLVPEGNYATQRQEGLKMELGGPSKQDPSILCLYREDERINEESASQTNWSKLQEALKIRDVSMEAIQLFQQFRFNCETVHLPW